MTESATRQHFFWWLLVNAVLSPLVGAHAGCALDIFSSGRFHTAPAVPRSMHIGTVPNFDLGSVNVFCHLFQ